MATPLLITTPLLLSLLAAAPPRAECSVGGSAPDRLDVQRAQHACQTARSRFAELFGDSVPAVHIALHDGSGYEVANAGSVGIVFWPHSGALVPEGMTAPRAWIDRQWDEVLPHEIMHALTMALFYADADANSHGGYGTPLPDWFEEGIAIWGEPHSSREGRLAQARALPEHRRELFAILATPHPAAANPGIIAATPGAAVPRDDALRAFYPQSIAVLTFVFEAGGPSAVRELGRRLAANPGDEHALFDLPGLPAERIALSGAFQRWMAADRP